MIWISSRASSFASVYIIAKQFIQLCLVFVPLHVFCLWSYELTALYKSVYYHYYYYYYYYYYVPDDLSLAASKLFKSIQSPSHCPSHRLPPEKNLSGLRSRGHGYVLPICQYSFCRNSFILRCIFHIFVIVNQRWHYRLYFSLSCTRFSDRKGMQGWVDVGTAVEVRSPCPRLYITVAVTINTTVRGVIRTWVFRHCSRTRQPLGHCDIQFYLSLVAFLEYDFIVAEILLWRDWEHLYLFCFALRMEGNCSKQSSTWWVIPTLSHSLESLCLTQFAIFIDYFSGPSSAVDSVCAVCACVFVGLSA